MPLVALGVWLAILLGSPASPGPAASGLPTSAGSPTASASVAPVSTASPSAAESGLPETLPPVPADTATPVPAPSGHGRRTAKPSPPPKAPLVEIGRVRAVSPFCRAFAEHFNSTVVTMLANDAQVSYIDHSLGNVFPDLLSMDRDGRFYDERLRLVAYVDHLQKALPGERSEIHALWQTAQLTSDPALAAKTRALAKALNISYLRQRSVAIDILGVTQSMADFQPQVSKIKIFDAQRELQDEPSGFRDFRSYLHFQFTLDKIRDAEDEAARTASSLSDSCF